MNLSVLAICQSVGGFGFGIAAISYLIVAISRLRLARHFGDRALTLTGKKAEHAHELARESLRGLKTPWGAKYRPPS